MTFARHLALVAATALFGTLTGCGSTSIPPAFEEQTVRDTEFRIEPSDVLEIRVWKNPELTLQGPVLPDGTISVPLVGAVHGQGLTTTELEDAIAQRLSEYITSPEVSVLVVNVNSKRVSVIGEVNRSGPFDLGINTRIMDALSMAGGFTTYANKRNVKLIRRTETGDQEFHFNYNRYSAGNAPGTNVLLQPGDVIVVSD